MSNLKKKYKTKGFDCWPLMKELRRKRFKEEWEAQARGAFVVTGMYETYLSLLEGIGEYCNPSYGPHYTRIARHPEKLTKLIELSEDSGYGNNICAALRGHLGQLLSGYSVTSPWGKIVRPMAVFQPGQCYAYKKMGQIFAEHLGIPSEYIDTPWKKTPATIQYVVSQLNEKIEFFEKHTGVKYDDERLIKSVKNEWETSVLWAKICELNKNIPAPTDMRTAFSLRLPFVTQRQKDRCVEYARILYDEMKDRVDHGTAANELELMRFTHEGLHTLFGGAAVLRYPERYGAIFVMGSALLVFGAWDLLEDGTLTPMKTPEQKGIEIKSRDDALACLAELYFTYPTAQTVNPIPKPKVYVKRIKDYQCDGAVIFADSGCTGECGIFDAREALREAGIPVMTYDGSHGDPRTFSEENVRSNFDTFAERLGLEELS